MPDLDAIHAAAQRLDTIANTIHTNGGRDTALRPTADLLRAVAETHTHYRDCDCAEAHAATLLAHAILGSQP